MHIPITCLISFLLISVLFLSHGSGQFNEDRIHSFFPSDYGEARTNFIKAVASSGGTVQSYLCPVPGPIGEELFTDVAWFGTANPSSILVVNSGAHGVEGFAGSALQTGLLRQGIASNLPPGIALVMIHAINPYGMAHLRRVNEDNVDLNRNFLNHDTLHPQNEDYNKLASAISPTSNSLWSDIVSFTRIGWFTLFNGKKKLKEAVSQGQYSHPEGLFFGGRKQTWSNRTLREIITQFPPSIKQAIFIGIHTGLGENGQAEIIMNVAKDSIPFQRAVSLWGDYVKTTVTDESVSANLHGTIKLALPKMVPHAEVIAVSLEFGSLPTSKVFFALRDENWLHHHAGASHPKYNEIKEGLLRAFYPEDNAWQIKVWTQGRNIVHQALSCLSTRG